MSLFLFSNTFAAKRQFNFNIGQDYPEKGEKRSGTATMAKFGVSTEPKWIRLVTSFTLSVGSSFKQGDLGAGPYLYFLSDPKRASIQPFVFAEGMFGVGQYLEETRTNAGGEFGVGTDLRTFNESGMTFALSIVTASETSFRIWLGYYFF